MNPRLEGYYVYVKNGLLYLDRETAQWVFTEHSPKHYRTYLQPVIYDPSATCPGFKKFLTEICMLEVEEDQSEFATQEQNLKIQLLLEMMGYSMLSTTEFERMFLLLGAPGSGKSTLLNILGNLLGEENYTAIRPSVLDKEFQAKQLFGKLANIIAEEGNKKLPAEVMKNIASGDRMYTNVKHKDGIDFRPFATQIIASNQIPKVDDHSGAFHDRLSVVVLSNNFRNSVNRRTNYAKELICESSGILNLVLDATSRLIQHQGRFSQSNEERTLIKKWRNQDGDITNKFLTERCYFSAEANVSRKELFKAYVIYTSGKREMPVSKNRLFAVLREHGTTIDERRDRKRGRYFKGVGLK